MTRRMTKVNAHFPALLRAAVMCLISFIFAGCAHTPTPQGDTAIGLEAADTAVSMIGKPYRYGGYTPGGFDCSGLVYFSYAQVGRAVPRTTGDQKRRARPVPYRSMRRGDLVFFSERGRRYSHVGIYVGDEKFVHAPSSGKHVRIDSLLDPYWRRHFLDARRPY
jgi:murein DD-endopeptidase